MKRARVKSDDPIKPPSPGSESGSKRRRGENFAQRELQISDGYASYLTS
jgi:hypothetical protein